MDLSQDRLNSESEKSGVWIEIDNETSLLIARYLNPSHKQYVQARLEPYKRLIRMNKMDDEVALKIEKEAMAKYVLLDWKGMKEGGEELFYSEDNAIRLLTDPQLEWFFDLVKDLSNDLSIFKQEMLEDGIDNVKK